MDHLNPIIEDYKLLTVFKNIGQQLLQQVKGAMSAPPYTNFFKEITLTEQNELHFSYLQHHFKTQIEVFFNHSKMPKSAFIATYHLPQDKGKDVGEIISYAFNLDYTINGIYTFDDFAAYYLIEFHQNLKKSFSDNDAPFAIKGIGK